ncbi:MAG: DNA repair photolyase [Betaproteobacteria bacterium RBG_16_64_9]|nr:MAG: DNA repair photolyase [Betaproteobacteria bacterium RBG_16_64_9]OGA25025.1 MAG: DNA repair photolyase [Betaproteobacteria bacterium RIFCSPLOWO2_02_FULL_65_24]OGA32914.1 MAG: DNA repair photolyase [Betaproteobacteria bacterium RIFCSPLOWO2_12_FULL_62_13b]
MDKPSIKGRGAAGNPQGRFEILAREREQQPDEAAQRPRTTVTLHRSRSIISRNQSPDVGFNRSINPYQGCEHGCIYCYARPSHAYYGLSPGLEFETRLLAKHNAAGLLRKELARPAYRCEVIALGVNTDAYQPVERERKLTRSLLEVLWEHRHPVSLITKSALIERDIDLLASMAREGLTRVFFSINCLDGEIARRLEPRAAAPYRRIEAMRRLTGAGIPCGVMVAPVIPFLTDKDIEPVLGAAKAAGAVAAGYVLLRLPHEVKGLFKDWLARHYPLRAEHVMARLRDMRAGRENDPNFGSRMSGEGEYAQLIARRFEVAAGKLGLEEREDSALDTSKFRVPEKDLQGSLFEA